MKDKGKRKMERKESSEINLSRWGVDGFWGEGKKIAADLKGQSFLRANLPGSR